jgi:hypothetical protein
VSLITIENLHDVPIRVRVKKLEYIGARLQNRVSDLNGLIDGKNGFLVPLVRLRPMRDESSADRDRAKYGHRPGLDKETRLHEKHSFR